MADGYTFICATCPKLHTAKEVGSDLCLGNVSGRTCSGPLNQGTYPEYSGPLKDSMTSHCFLTGAPSTGAVDIQGTLIGVSEKAIEVLKTFSKKGGTAPPSITEKHLPVVG